MSPIDQEIIRYRIQRAQETLDEASILLHHEKWNAAVNRMYYACYYIVIALLKQENISHATHSGVKAQFNKLVASTLNVDKQHARFFNHIMQDRQESDYKDLYFFDPEEVKTMMPMAQAFVSEIEKLITFS